jgi:hypothetical protein
MCNVRLTAANNAAGVYDVKHVWVTGTGRFIRSLVPLLPHRGTLLLMNLAHIHILVSEPSKFPWSQSPPRTRPARAPHAVESRFSPPFIVPEA